MKHQHIDLPRTIEHTAYFNSIFADMSLLRTTDRGKFETGADRALACASRIQRQAAHMAETSGVMA